MLMQVGQSAVETEGILAASHNHSNGRTQYKGFMFLTYAIGQETKVACSFEEYTSFLKKITFKGN